MFKGRNSIQDGGSPGKPTRVSTPQIVDSGNQFILVDRIKHVYEQLGNSVGTARKIVHDDFAFS